MSFKLPNQDQLRDACGVPARPLHRNLTTQRPTEHANGTIEIVERLLERCDDRRQIVRRDGLRSAVTGQINHENLPLLGQHRHEWRKKSAVECEPMQQHQR